jgi:hypothetical protein
VTTRVSGDLTITGPGVTMRLNGAGDDVRLTLEGRAGRVGPVGGAVAEYLAAAGVALDVTDAGGRRIARVGAVPPSVVGRLLAGSRRVRPTPRGVITTVRGRLARGLHHRRRSS